MQDTTRQNHSSRERMASGRDKGSQRHYSVWVERVSAPVYHLGYGTTDETGARFVAERRRPLTARPPGQGKLPELPQAEPHEACMDKGAQGELSSSPWRSHREIAALLVDEEGVYLLNDIQQRMNCLMQEAIGDVENVSKGFLSIHQRHTTNELVKREVGQAAWVIRVLADHDRLYKRREQCGGRTTRGLDPAHGCVELVDERPQLSAREWNAD